jgi:hypothetical protein
MSVSGSQSSGGRKGGLIVLAILLAIFAVFGYLYYFGFPFGVTRIASIMDNNTAAATTTTTTSITATTVVVTTTTVTRTVTVTAAGFPDVGSFEVSGVVGGIKNALSGLFVWLLGSSLMDALFNLGIVIVLLIFVYAAMKFAKYIAIFVFVVGVLLIVLRYILGVI